VVSVDYTTIAIIAGASGFFGAFGTEFARYLLGEVRRIVKEKQLVKG